MLDITGILKDEEGVAEDVIHEAAQLLKQSEQARLRSCHDRLTRAHIAGGGERPFFQNGFSRAMIDPASYHYWGQRLGYECWDDEQFMKEYLRDNPLCRVKSVSNKIQIGYSPTASRSTYHKKYAEAKK